MKQQYFVTVRTTGPYNANKSTRELCSLIRQKLDKTTIASLDDIDLVLDYINFTIAEINDKYPRSKPLKTERQWATGYANEVCKSHHITVKIDNFTNGDGSFLQLDFTPTRHAYGETVFTELVRFNNYLMYKQKYPNRISYPKPPKKHKVWDYTKAQDGDIICEDYVDWDTGDIIIYRGIYNQGLLFHALYNKEYGLVVHVEPSGMTTGYVGTHDYRYATEEEKGIIFNELSVRGLRWNPTTLQIEETEQ